MRLTMKIGVLAVQGAFIEHEHMIEEIGHTAIEIRQRDDLEGLDGLILPGGESTVQGQLLNKLDMMKDIKNMIINTCKHFNTIADIFDIRCSYKCHRIIADMLNISVSYKA